MQGQLRASPVVASPSPSLSPFMPPAGPLSSPPPIKEIVNVRRRSKSKEMSLSSVHLHYDQLRNVNKALGVCCVHCGHQLRQYCVCASRLHLRLRLLLAFCVHCRTGLRTHQREVSVTPASWPTRSGQRRPAAAGRRPRRGREPLPLH